MDYDRTKDLANAYKALHHLGQYPLSYAALEDLITYASDMVLDAHEAEIQDLHEPEHQEQEQALFEDYVEALDDLQGKISDMAHSKATDLDLNQGFNQALEVVQRQEQARIDAKSAAICDIVWAVPQNYKEIDEQARAIEALSS